MKKEEKYLKQVRLYRKEEQIKRTAFEMALYFDYFGFNEEDVLKVYNTTFDNEEFSDEEKEEIFDKVSKLVKNVYKIKI